MVCFVLLFCFNHFGKTREHYHHMLCRFGAFGKIAHFRLIQAKIPHVAHIRFENETSASKAMNWVNTELSSHGLSAKNGYRKYCPRFTQGKVCHSQQRCFVDKLHEWRPMSDVVNPEQVQRIKLQIQKKESIPGILIISNLYSPQNHNIR